MEVKYFLEQMQDYRTETFGSYTYYTEKTGSIPVVVSRTDWYASTMLLIEKYNPKDIINQGTAGGHDPDLQRYVNYGKFQYETQRSRDRYGSRYVDCCAHHHT
nr:hypothetical protein [Thermicanus aegyptius]